MVYGYGALDVAPNGRALFHPAEEVLLSCFVATRVGDAVTSVTGAVAEADLTGPAGGTFSGSFAIDRHGPAITGMTPTGEINDLTTQKTYKAEPLPPFMRELVEAGGLLPYLKKRAAAK